MVHKYIYIWCIYIHIMYSQVHLHFPHGFGSPLDVQGAAKVLNQGPCLFVAHLGICRGSPSGFRDGAVVIENTVVNAWLIHGELIFTIING